MKTYDELLLSAVTADRTDVIEGQLSRIETKLLEFLTAGDDKLQEQFLQSITFPFTADFTKLELRIINKKLSLLGYRTALGKKEANWAITVYL